MRRIYEPELLDRDGVPDDAAMRAYRDLARIHRFLGDTNRIVRTIRNDPLPVRRVLDVGCATGSVLEHVRRKLNVEAIGVDLSPRPQRECLVTILRADAVRDPLPTADVAFCMHLGHHLEEPEVIQLIRNVGRYCRRFVLLDLVRHPLPLALFRLFVAPLVCRIAATDGATSVRRSYTAAELNRLAIRAVDGSGATFRHTVSPLYTRQVIDISYR